MAEDVGDLSRVRNRETLRHLDTGMEITIFLSGRYVHAFPDEDQHG